MSKRPGNVLERDINKRVKKLSAEEILWENMKEVTVEKYLTKRYTLSKMHTFEMNRSFMQKSKCFKYFRVEMFCRMNPKLKKMLLIDPYSPLDDFLFIGMTEEHLSLTPWGQGLRYTLCQRACQHKCEIADYNHGPNFINFVDKIFWYLGGNALDEWKEWKERG